MVKLLSLHLIPAIIWLIFYIPLAKIASENGIPTLFVFYILVVLILVPFELGFLYYQGKKLNGRLTLKGVVLYREKMPWWQYLVFGIISFGWLVFIILNTTQITNFLDTNLFFWIPDWFYLDRGNIEQNAPLIEITMWILGFIFIGIIGPLTEELYFRGYLLPRLSKFGIWAPLLNSTLFLLYHLWQPSFFVTAFIGGLPWMYIVWWKKNVYFSIGLHCFLNTFGLVMDLLQRLGS